MTRRCSVQLHPDVYDIVKKALPRGYTLNGGDYRTVYETCGVRGWRSLEGDGLPYDFEVSEADPNTKAARLSVMDDGQISIEWEVGDQTQRWVLRPVPKPVWRECERVVIGIDPTSRLLVTGAYYRCVGQDVTINCTGRSTATATLIRIEKGD